MRGVTLNAICLDSKEENGKVTTRIWLKEECIKKRNCTWDNCQLYKIEKCIVDLNFQFKSKIRTVRSKIIFLRINVELLIQSCNAWNKETQLCERMLKRVMSAMVK